MGLPALLLGLEPGGSTQFDITFPDDYPEESLQGQQAHFAVQIKELREKIQPPLDDDFAGQLGDFKDLAALRADIQHRLAHSLSSRSVHSGTRDAHIQLDGLIAADTRHFLFLQHTK